jgi:hypothetical protein
MEVEQVVSPARTFDEWTIEIGNGDPFLSF